MRYGHSKNRVDIPVTQMRKRLWQAAVHDAETSMTKRRFVSTFATSMLCLILVYSSLFYVPAYVDVPKLVGVSSQNGKFPKTNEQPGTMDRYLNVFKMRRGYLNEGQYLMLEYKLTPGTAMVAAIGRCSAPPVIEVFYCQKIDERRFRVRSTMSGTEKFVISKPGFYYFDEVVTEKDGSTSKRPYQLSWSRGKTATTQTPETKDTTDTTETAEATETAALDNEKGPRLRLRQSPQ